MNNDILKTVKQLPIEKQNEVEDFINYLANKYLANQPDTNKVAEMRMHNMGWAKGKVWMAEDFNETPEDFKDYL